MTTRNSTHFEMRKAASKRRKEASVGPVFTPIKKSKVTSAVCACGVPRGRVRFDAKRTVIYLLYTPKPN